MKKIVALLAALVILASAGAVMAQQIAFEGDKAVKVKDVMGKEMPAAEVFKGKKTVLVFSQTACANCRQELKYLMKGKNDFPNLTYAVAIVDMKIDPDRIKGYLDSVGFDGTVLTDPTWDLAGVFGVNFTPATVIIDKDGTQLYTHAGFSVNTAGKLREELKKAN